jgi:hypothetical protein
MVAYVWIVFAGVAKMHRMSAPEALRAATCWPTLGAVTSKRCVEMMFDCFAPRPALSPFR